MSRDITTETLSDLVGAVYEAAYEPDRWSITLPRMIEMIGGERGFLGFTSPVRGFTRYSVSHEVADEMLRCWQEDYDGFDPWYERSGALPAGTVVQGFEVVPWDELKTIEAHRALFHKNGIDDLLCASVASYENHFDFVTIHRSMKRGPYQPHEIRRMKLLAPHLVRAAQLHDKLSFLSEIRIAHEASLNRLPFGVVMIDDAGLIVELNERARTVLSARDGLDSKEKRLRASHPESRKRLDAALDRTHRSERTGNQSAGALLTVRRPSLARDYQLLVAPVPERPRERVFGIVARRVSTIVVIVDPEIAPEPAAAGLARLFGLTPALGRLAAALAAGKTLVDYANETGISEGTARWHLKEIFSRTNTRRQPELVRLLLTSIASLSTNDVE